MEKLAYARVLTPFGRQPAAAIHVKQARDAAKSAPVAQIDKWVLLRDLATARRVFGVSDRDISVLQALLSFHKPVMIADTGAPVIVFPSNATLATRAHGMAESTLRRHLATLVKAGLIARHDSPNGKRYRNAVSAYGFDLRPLLLQAADIARAAADEMRAARELAEAREHLTLVLRDIFKLAQYGEAENMAGEWSQINIELCDLYKCRRRKLDIAAVSGLIVRAEALLARVEAAFGIHEKTSDSSADDNHFERHIQSKTTDNPDSEGSSIAPSEPSQETVKDAGAKKTQPSLHRILTTCPEIRAYAGGKVDSCQHLVNAAHMVRSMMGISQDLWHEAIESLGLFPATVVLCTILQRFETIQNPGGYLRTLARRGEVDLDRLLDSCQSPPLRRY